jgi:hypothetical protein
VYSTKLCKPWHYHLSIHNFLPDDDLYLPKCVKCLLKGIKETNTRFYDGIGLCIITELRGDTMAQLKLKESRLLALHQLVR